MWEVASGQGIHYCNESLVDHGNKTNISQNEQFLETKCSDQWRGKYYCFTNNPNESQEEQKSYKETGQKGQKRFSLLA